MSYYDLVMRTIVDNKILTNTFPVLNFITQATLKNSTLKLFDFSDGLSADGSMADSYKNQLDQLGDIDFSKYAGNEYKELNKHISNVFKYFSHAVYFQHGVGKNRFGFANILNAEKFTDLVKEPVLNFQKNVLSSEDPFSNLEGILKTLLANTEFKNYTEASAVETVQEESDDESTIVFPSVKKPTQAPVSVTNNPAEYTNHSGGAIGSDTQWDVIGKEFGMVNNRHYFTGEKGPKNAPLGNVDITNDPIAVEGASKVAQAAKQMWGYKYNTMKDQRLIRNWAQVANSDAVFAIGTLGKEGDIWKGDEKSAEPRKLLKFAVQGGTGYAVEMAIQAGKPVYVFDQVRNQWYKNINGEWSKSEVPTLTKNFAGIGTREINEAGKQAIRDVYAKTFSQPVVQGVKPTVKDLSRWSDIKDATTPYTDKGIVVTRISGSKEHFGNPFIGSKRRDKNGNIVESKVDNITMFNTIDEADQAYRDWLMGTKHQNIEPLRREWILKQINEGKLDGKTLLYYKPMEVTNNDGSIVRGGYHSHADTLAEVVEQLRTTQPTVQPVGEVKEGVVELFEAKPHLSQIGTPQQYSEWINYLTTQGKLAGTQATDILYHGTDKEFDSFDKTKRGSATGESYFQDEEQTPIDSLNAFFFSTEPAVSEQYGLLRRLNQVQSIATLLQYGRTSPERYKSLKNYSPELADHLREKQKELNTEDFSKYLESITLKYSKVNDDLGEGFLNEYNNYIRLGKQLKDILNKKQDILSGKYVHETFSKQYPNLSIYLYDKPYDSTRIDPKGKISRGKYDGKNITELTETQFDDLLSIGNASYKKGIDTINSKLKKAKITPILYRVLLNVQKPLVKDFENKPFVNQAYEAGAQYEASKLTNQAAKSKGQYDSVIFKNILDPYLSDNYGVFEPEQVYILGGTEDTEGFKEFVSGQPTVPVREIKPGVAELFESNPELANRVYEALGFVTGLDKLKSQDLKTKVGESFGSIKSTGEMLRNYISGDFANEFKLTQEQVDLLIEIVNMGEDNIGTNPYVDYEDYSEAEQKKYNLRDKTEEDVDNEWARIKYKFPNLSKEDIWKTTSINDIGRSIDRNFKWALLYELTGESDLPNNLVELELAKVTPQQKQQAQQLYSQYLEQNPNGDIEGFKNFVSTQPTVEPEDNYEMSLEEELRIKENELKFLQEISEESNETRIELIVVNNLKKITPQSAQRETGGKAGIKRDIDISFLNNNGSTVEGAAEDIWMDLDISYQNMYDVQDIRNMIIDILMTGKKKYIEDYTPNFNLIENLKSDIALLKEKIKQKKTEGSINTNLNLFGLEGFNIPNTGDSC